MRAAAFLLLLACKEEPTQTTTLAGTVAMPETRAATGCPAWTDLRRCKAEGFVYAAANGPQSRLGEKSAANRARAALGGDIIEHAEVPAVAHCQGDTYALARAPVTHIANADSMPACTTSLDAPAPAKGCPDWTVRRLYREGDTLYAVSVVDPKLGQLAQSQAENAARAEAMEYARFHASGANRGSVRAQKGSQRVECDGTVYLRLGFHAP